MALNSKMSVEEFSKKLKEKYPQYKDVDDNELVSKMIQKYPQYKDKVEVKKKEYTTKDSQIPSEPSNQSGVKVDDEIVYDKYEQPTVDDVIESYDDKIPNQERVDKSVQSITSKFTEGFPMQEYGDYDSKKTAAIEAIKNIQKSKKSIYDTPQQAEIQDGIAIQPSTGEPEINPQIKELYEAGALTMENARKAFKSNYIDENPDIIKKLNSENEEDIEDANKEIYDAWLKEPEILSGTERTKADRSWYEEAYDSFREGIDERDFNLQMAKELAYATDEEAKKLLELEYNRATEKSKDIQEPQEDLTSLQGVLKMAGTQAMPIVQTTAISLIPGIGKPASIIYGAGDAGATSYGAAFRATYIQARNEGKDEKEAYDIAKDQAKINFTTGAVEGAFGAVTGGYAKVGGKYASKFASKALKPLVNSAATGASDIGIDAAVAATGQMINNWAAKNQGLNTDLFEGVADEMLGEVIFSAGGKGLTQAYKSSTSIGDFRKYIKSLPPQEQQEIFNSVVDNKENLERKILNDRTNDYLNLKGQEALDNPAEAIKGDLRRLNKIHESLTNEDAKSEVGKNIDALSLMLENVEQRVVIKEGDSENIIGSEELVDKISDPEFVAKVANGEIDVEVSNNEDIGNKLNDAINKYREENDSEKGEQVPSTKQEGETVEQAEPIEEPSGEEVEASGVVQEEGRVILDESIKVSDDSGRKGLIPTDELKKFIGEDRTGAAEMTTSRETINKLKDDISKNGFKEPIIVMYDETTGEASIIEGNHRMAAAIEMGMKEVPVSFEKGRLRSDEQRAKDKMFPLNRVNVGKLNTRFGVSGVEMGFTMRQPNESDFAQNQKTQTTEVISGDTKGIKEVTPEEFSEKLKKSKEADPKFYWSVDEVSKKDLEEGKILSAPGGNAVVSKDGDIKGVFKEFGAKDKGFAKNILTKAVEAGGTKLDNFDGALTKIYQDNGFRVVSRTPFNEEFAPKDWDEETHGRPDIVAMVYDPENKLDIKEKMFDNPETGYQEAIDYRDSYISPPTPPVDTDRPNTSGDDKEKIVDSIAAYARGVVPNEDLRKSEITPLLKGLEDASKSKDYEAVLDKIDEIAKKAQTRARIKKLNKVRRKAKKNVKKKLGYVSVQAKAILDAENIPEDLFDKYEKVVNSLGERATILQPDMDGLNELYNELQKRNEVIDDSFNEDVEVKEKKEVELASEEDIESVKESVKNIDKKNIDFNNKDTDRYVLQFLGLPKDYLLTLPKSTVNNIGKEVNNISNGFISNGFVADVISDYNGWSKANQIFDAKNDLGRKNDSESFEGGVEDLKSILTDKEKLDEFKSDDKAQKKFKKKASNRMLQHIDRYVGSIQNNKFYSNLISPFSQAEGAKERVVNSIVKRINPLINDAIKSNVGSVNFRLGKTHEAQYRLNAMIDMYLIAKQYIDNPDSSKTPSLKDVVDKISNDVMSSNKSNLSVRDLEIITKIYSEISDDNGNVDVDKFKNEYMTKQERALVDFMENEYSGHRDKYVFLQQQLRGETPETIDSYAHRSSVYGNANEIDANTIYDNIANGSISGSTRAGATKERVSGTPLVRLGGVSNFINYIEEINTDYYLSPVVKEFNKTIKHLDKEGNKSTKMIAKSMKDLIKQNLADSYRRSNSSVTGRKKLLKILMSNVAKKILISPIRITQEITNYLAAIPDAKILMDKDNIKVRKEAVDNGVFEDILNDYGTSQAGRVTGGYSIDYKDTDLTKSLKSGFKTSDVATVDKTIDFLKNNLATDFGNWAASNYYKVVDAFLTTGWQANFVDNFKKLTGEDFKPLEYKNNKEYRAEYDSKIQEAVAMSDKNTSDYYNTASRFEQKIKGKSEDPLSVTNLLSNFMQSFSFNEQSTLTDAFKSVAGKGTMQRDEALAKFSVLTIRAITYQLIGDGIYRFISSMLTDEEQDDVDKLFERAGANYLALLVMGNSPAWAKTALGNVINTGVAAYKEIVDGEKYNPYKDNLMFGNSMSSAKDIYGLFGSFGDVLRTGTEFKETYSGIFDKIKKGEKVTPEDVVKLKALQTSYNALSTLLGLPGMKDVKFIQKALDSKYGIKRGGEKSSTSGIGGSISGGL